MRKENQQLLNFILWKLEYDGEDAKEEARKNANEMSATEFKEWARRRDFID